jgi:hypothetical protein
VGWWALRQGRGSCWCVESWGRIGTWDTASKRRRTSVAQWANRPKNQVASESGYCASHRQAQRRSKGEPNFEGRDKPVERLLAPARDSKWIVREENQGRSRWRVEETGIRLEAGGQEMGAVSCFRCPPLPRSASCSLVREVRWATNRCGRARSVWSQGGRNRGLFWTARRGRRNVDRSPEQCSGSSGVTIAMMDAGKWSAVKSAT